MTVSQCDRCGTVGKVTVNDPARANGSVYRRRHCPQCGHRWSSHEVRTDVTQMVLVVSKDFVKAMQRQMMSLLGVMEEIHVINPTEDV